MAETVKIEIPINATDGTSGVVGNIQKKITALDKAVEKMEKRLQKIGGSRVSFDIDAHDTASGTLSGIEETIASVNKSGGTIDISANDTASDVISGIEDDANALDNTDVVVDVTANNTATDEISGVSGDVEALNGDSAVVDVSANNTASEEISNVDSDAEALNGTEVVLGISLSDTATEELSSVKGDTEALNGSSAVVEISAHDTATEVITSVSDALAALNGSSAIVEISAHDTATVAISSVSGDLEALNGSSAVVEISANDTATELIADAEAAISSLDGQSATVTIEAADNTGGLIGGLIDSGASGGADGLGVGDAAGLAGAGVSMAKAGMGKALGFLGLAIGAKDIMSTYAGFEQTMSEVEALSSANEAQMDALTEKAKYMGMTTKFTAQAAAEAYKYMALASWSPEQMIAGIDGIMNLAAASGEALGTTSDIVTDAMTAFGMSVEGFTENGVPNVTHFADVLARTTASSNTDVAKLGETFKYAASSAGALGFSIEDVAFASGLMANAGIKSSMAGTSLRRAFQALSAPTETQLAAMEKYGITLDDGTGNARDFVDVMTDLRTNLSGLGNIEQSKAITDMFGTTASNGLKAIVKASEDDWNELKKAIYEDSDGSAEEMSSIMLDNLAGSITLLGSAFEGLKLALGEGFSDELTTLIDGLTAKLPELTEAVTGAFDDIDKAFEEDGTEGGINKIAEVITGALTTALSDAGNWFSENGGDFGTVAGQLIGQLAEGLAANSGDIIGAGIQIIGGLAQGLAKGAGVLVGSAPAIIVDLVGGILQNIPSLFQAGIELIGALKDGLIAGAEGIGEFFTDLISVDPDPIEIKTEIDYDNPGAELLDAALSSMEDTGSRYSTLSDKAQGYFEELARGTKTVSGLAEEMEGMADSMDAADAQWAIEAFGQTLNELFDQGIGVTEAAEETADGLDAAGDAAESNAEKIEGAMERVMEASDVEQGTGMDSVIEDLDELAESYSNVGDAAEEALDFDLADSLGGLTGDTLSSLLESEDMAAKAEEINAAMQTVADGISESASQMDSAVSGSMSAMSSSIAEAQAAFEALQEAATQALSAAGSATGGAGEAGSGAGAAASSADTGAAEGTPVTVDIKLQVGEVDTSEVVSGITEAVTPLDGETYPVGGKVDATLSVGDENSAEVYSSVSSAVQGQFNTPIDASGTVNVTLAWHITNPTASISVGVSGGTATATIASAGMANGGFVDGAMLSLIGEDGPEFIIPVGSKRRDRGVELWAKAGDALGMFDNIPAYADGGAVGIDESSMLANPFERNNPALNILGGLFPTANAQAGTNNAANASVSVNMSPVIQIEGGNMNEDEIFAVMKSRIKEMADDVGMEVGEKLMKIFGNMPLAAEVG